MILKRKSLATRFIYFVHDDRFFGRIVINKKEDNKFYICYQPKKREIQTVWLSNSLRHEIQNYAKSMNSWLPSHLFNEAVQPDFLLTKDKFFEIMFTINPKFKMEYFSEKI